MARAHFSSANVRDDGSPLALGVAPAREAEIAGAMTKVPKAWGFGPSRHTWGQPGRVRPARHVRAVKCLPGHG